MNSREKTNLVYKLPDTMPERQNVLRINALNMTISHKLHLRLAD